jgi:hypothetical protein
LPDIAGDLLAAVGAFLSGVGAVIGASWAMYRLKKADEEECEKRLAAFREGLAEGRRSGP